MSSHVIIPLHDSFQNVVTFLDGWTFARLTQVNKECRSTLRSIEEAFYAERMRVHAWFFGHGDVGTSYLSRFVRLNTSSHHRMIVCGGSTNRGDEDQYLAAVDHFALCFDAPPSATVSACEPMSSARDACAVSRSVLDHSAIVAGGWNGRRALASVEFLPPEGTTWIVSQHKLVQPRCFTASVVAGDGTLLVFGGGEHLYQGAEVFTSVEALPGGPQQNQFSFAVRPELELLVPRTGHIVDINRNTNQVLVVAGYGGSTIYRQSAELLDLTGWEATLGSPASGGLKQGNKQTSMFRPISHQLSTPRTGCVGGFGPFGSFYCCGGSTDGGNAVATLERLDLREPTGWELKNPMSRARGYFAGAFAPDGCLYVSGGSRLLPPEIQFHNGIQHIVRPQETLNSIEFYDPRADRWSSVSQNLHPERADHSMCCLLRLGRSSIESLMCRNNPVDDVWQRRTMMTL